MKYDVLVVCRTKIEAENRDQAIMKMVKEFEDYSDDISVEHVEIDDFE